MGVIQWASEIIVFISITLVVVVIIAIITFFIF